MADEKDLQSTQATTEVPAVAETEKLVIKAKPTMITRKPAQEKQDVFWGTGRRKTSVARARLIPGGTGKIMVNGKDFTEFFKHKRLEPVVVKPLQVTDMAGKFDVKARVQGGGITGQAEALSLGIARALVCFNETLRKVLRDEGLMTRDPRMVERKKYGQAGARKRFQFSKR